MNIGQSENGHWWQPDNPPGTHRPSHHGLFAPPNQCPEVAFSTSPHPSRRLVRGHLQALVARTSLCWFSSTQHPISHLPGNLFPLFPFLAGCQPPTLLRTRSHGTGTIQRRERAIVQPPGETYTSTTLPQTGSFFVGKAYPPAGTGSSSGGSGAREHPPLNDGFSLAP